MKKKLLTVLMTIGAVSMLCGFDSAETADTVLQKQQEAVAAVSSTAADVTVNADVAINFSGASLTAAANGGIDVEVLTTEPALKIDGSIDVVTPLMGQENTYDFKVYFETDESGSSDVYIYHADAVTGESAWDHESADDVDFSGLMNTATSMNASQLSSLGINFTLAPEAADVDGTECYKVSTIVDSTTFTTILDAASTLTGQDMTADESVALAMEVLEGVKITLEYYIDTATFLPVKMHMDLNDSDLTAIEQLLSAYMTSAMGSEEEMTMDIVLNDLSMDMTTAYNTVTEITVPEEAYAANSYNDIVPDGVESNVEDAVEAITEAAAQ